MSSALSQGPVFLLGLLLLMGIVVTIHELGHYFAGRWYGAAVDSFSIGFGKPIAERKDKRGTRWRINWIPLGGFVKFVGENQMPSDVDKTETGPKGRAYKDIGVGGRSVILAAGPAANFLLAIVLFALVAWIQGDVRHDVVVAGVGEDSPASAAGFEPGDRLVSINGVELANSMELISKVQLSSDRPLTIAVERDRSLIELTATPERREITNRLGQTQALGFIDLSLAPPTRETVERISYNPVEAIGQGVLRTGDTLATSATMLGRIVTGSESLSLLSGPVSIGDTSRRIVNTTMENESVPLGARLGHLALNMVIICAAVSVGIGFFNLLPLPVLDGGHLVFNAYEAVTGKPLPDRVQEAALTAGLVLLLGMFVVITWGDLLETGLFNAVQG